MPNSPKRRRTPLKTRYKPGFDRLAVVLLAVFAAGFAIVALAVNDPWSLPPPGSEGHAGLQAELEAECNPDIEEALYTLCRERVLAPSRWRHYRDQLPLAGDWPLWLMAALLLGAALPAARWVVRGFAEGYRPAGGGDDGPDGPEAPGPDRLR